MSVLTFDEMVRGLTELGVDRKVAEERARIECGLPAIETAQLDADALEDAHVAEGDKIVRALGGKVVAFSQKRATKQTPGIPDRKYYFPRRKLTFWWEAKAEWGVQSPAQKDFQVMAEECRETYLLGELDALKNMLVCMNLCTINPDGSLEPVHHPGE